MTQKPQLTRGSEEAKELLAIIRASNVRSLTHKELEFVGKIHLKTQFPTPKFSDKEIFWLRDLKEKCL